MVSTMQAFADDIILPGPRRRVSTHLKVPHILSEVPGLQALLLPPPGNSVVLTSCVVSLAGPGAACVQLETVPLGKGDVQADPWVGKLKKTWATNLREGCNACFFILFLLFAWKKFFLFLN